MQRTRVLHRIGFIGAVHGGIAHDPVARRRLSSAAMRHATPRKFIPATVFALFLGACSSSSLQEVNTTSVLFVGNSLTYVGNLPAVFTALCDAAEVRCSTEMIVAGGAALGQRVDDLLGTYQSDPRASTALVEAESTLAASLNIPHIAVSNLFVCGRREHSVHKPGGGTYGCL